MKVFLTGYEYMDFPARDDPSKQIQGYNLYLAVENDRVIGFVPVGDGGKRFITVSAADKFGVDKKFFDEHLLSLIDIDTNFDGRITKISEFVG